MNKVNRLAELFGSKRALADACGIDPAIITRASKTDTAAVPPRFNKKIREALREKIKGMTASNATHFMAQVEACLDPFVCPTCGHALDEDRVV